MVSQIEGTLPFWAYQVHICFKYAHNLFSGLLLRGERLSWAVRDIGAARECQSRGVLLRRGKRFWAVTTATIVTIRRRWTGNKGMRSKVGGGIARRFEDHEWWYEEVVYSIIDCMNNFQHFVCSRKAATVAHSPYLGRIYFLSELNASDFYAAVPVFQPRLQGITCSNISNKP